MIKIETCDSTQTGELLRVLGYRMRGGCGSEVVLETVNATRAFLTIDSGFPLAELEQGLRTNRPFAYDYQAHAGPGALYARLLAVRQEDRQGAEFIDTFLGDPSLCRLYLGLSKLDPATADELRKRRHASRRYAPMRTYWISTAACSRCATEKPWCRRRALGKEPGPNWWALRPTSRGVLRKPGGQGRWLAGQLFRRAIAISDNPEGPVKDYLTEPERLKRFYAAIRGKVTSPGPARPVFRSNTDMLLLTTRLRLDPDGKPHIPGGLEVWRTLFIEHPPQGKYDAKLSQRGGGWKDADDVLEALFGLCRKSVENEPLKIFMA